MSIKIVEDGPEIILSKSEYERLLQEFTKSMMYYAGPLISFETWLRRRNMERAALVKDEK